MPIRIRTMYISVFFPWAVFSGARERHFSRLLLHGLQRARRHIVFSRHIVACSKVYFNEECLRKPNQTKKIGPLLVCVDTAAYLYLFTQHTRQHGERKDERSGCRGAANAAVLDVQQGQKRRTRSGTSAMFCSNRKWRHKVSPVEAEKMRPTLLNTHNTTYRWT